MTPTYIASLPGLTRQSRAPGSALAALDARLETGRDVGYPW